MRPAQGRTPLHVAAKYQAKCVELLINAGADVNAKNKEVRRFVAVARARYGERLREPFPLLPRHTQGKTPLHLAANGWGDGAVLGRAAKALLDAGACVNAKDSFGRTPLYYAGWHVNVAEELIRAGAERQPHVAGFVSSVLMDKFISMA